MLNAGAAAGAAGAAAAVRRRMQQEEEEMTPYGPGELEQYEFKFIRSATGQFKRPEKLRAFLAEEAQAGWELVELFDASRARLKRNISWREKDRDLPWDAYRTSVGMGEGGLVALILVLVFGFLIGIAGLAAAIANAK